MLKTKKQTKKTADLLETLIFEFICAQDLEKFKGNQ